MINFLNMKYFLVVAEARSFSAAAKQLYISQQTLSAHIAQIEEEIGTQLFERTRPLTLTPAGERFHRGAVCPRAAASASTRILQKVSEG